MLLIINVIGLILALAIAISLFKYSHRIYEQAEEFKKTSFDGKKYQGLNSVFVFNDKSAYYGYEILHFENSVKTNGLEILVPKEGLSIERVIKWEDIENKNLNETEQLILDVIPSDPLDEEKMMEISKSIREGHEYYKFIQEQERKEKIKAEYQKANYNDERRQNAKFGLDSMREYGRDVNQEKAQYEQKIRNNEDLISRIIQDVMKNDKQDNRENNNDLVKETK